MPELDKDALADYIAEHVVKAFYDNRMRKIETTNLKRDILNRKNPYLFKTKNLETPETYIRAALDAFLIAQEETLFGKLMENLAIHICGIVYDGKKAKEKKFRSVDLIFYKDKKCYIVGIKSGPNWGNSDQVEKMKEHFKKAKGILRSEGVTQEIIAINGCTYGRDNNPFKKDEEDEEKDYYKYCGQELWEFISDDKNLYLEFIKPLEKGAQARDDLFRKEYSKQVTLMSNEFGNEFAKTGVIDWDKLLKFISQKKASPLKLF